MVVDWDSEGGIGGIETSGIEVGASPTDALSWAAMRERKRESGRLT